MTELVKPNIKYEGSYITATEKLLTQNPFYAKNYSPDDLAGQIENWEKLERDEDIYRFWLVDENEYLGMIILRRKVTGEDEQIHYSINPAKQGSGYGKMILKLGLEQAKKLGFDKLYLSCKKENIASQKIIQANGGKFIKEKEVQGEKEKIVLYKYVIET